MGQVADQFDILPFGDPDVDDIHVVLGEGLLKHKFKTQFSAIEIQSLLPVADIVTGMTDGIVHVGTPFGFLLS